MATSPSPLELARAKQREMREAGIKITIKTPVEKANENPTSLRLAINARCYQCEGEDADPGVKWRIGNCTCAKTCALYPVRPYQRLKGTAR